MHDADSCVILDNCTVLGYLVAVKKNQPPVILLEYKDDYFTIPKTLYLDDNVNDRIYFFEQHRLFTPDSFVFPDQIERDRFWSSHKNVAKKATTHIYI